MKCPRDQTEAKRNDAVHGHISHGAAEEQFFNFYHVSDLFLNINAAWQNRLINTNIV